jgi:hypothetical protein
VGQVVLALLPTRLQGLVGSLTLSLPVKLTLHLGGDFGVLDWKFQNFWNFLSEEENGRPFLRVAETEVLFLLLSLAVLIDKQGRAVRAINQSIFLRCLWL